jgi:CDP-glucose 4,6-dehydratase
VEGLVSAPFANFYAGRRVLVTGHTGFKGAWLSLWLKELGAAVSGASLLPPTQPNLYELLPEDAFEHDALCDVRDLAAVEKTLARAHPDVVFHLAAQPLVRRSYAAPLETLQTNVLGTANVLEAVRCLGLPCPVVVVTTDKCYENPETGHALTESDPLGGRDVYSASKACAELVTRAWRDSFFQTDDRLGPIASVRAGNVIGGGDYAEDRLVPDCIRSLIARQPVTVRNPDALRPWQHVLECCSGYLWLAARLAQEGKRSPFAGAFNFGPDTDARRSVREVIEEILRHWPGEFTATPPAGGPHEAKLLWLSAEKAQRLLGWRPAWGFAECVGRTVDWYRRCHEVGGEAMADFSRAQIADYVAAARAKQLLWAG